MARTERESDRRRRREEKWQTLWCCRDQQRACTMAQASAEKLGLPKRKEWPQCHRESSWQERRSRPCQNEKEQSHLSRVPDHEERVKVGESRTLVRVRGIRARAWRGKSGLDREGWHILGRASKKSLPRTSRRKHERVSGRKSFSRRSAVH